MEVVTTRAGLARALGRLRSGEARVSFVPTMGALHEGHLALVDRAVESAPVRVVSIFVNPLQFGPGEDLDRYPRRLDADLALLEARGASLVFVPEVGEMFPGGGPTVTVDPGPPGEVLEGAARPGHFRGVLTVVARLLGLIRPDEAMFGRKDAQQAALVRRMVEDLALGVLVRVIPTVREPDGLALSSRNAYLTPEERAQAPGLYRGLQAGLDAWRSGVREAEGLLHPLRAVVSSHPLLSLDYAVVAHPDTLEIRREARSGDLLLVAARLGGNRLLDNEVLP